MLYQIDYQTFLCEVDQSKMQEIIKRIESFKTDTVVETKFTAIITGSKELLDFCNDANITFIYNPREKLVGFAYELNFDLDGDEVLDEDDLTFDMLSDIGEAIAEVNELIWSYENWEAVV